MTSNAIGTIGGTIKSNNSSGISQLLATDNTQIPSGGGGGGDVNAEDLDELIKQYFLDNDISINGTLNTNDINVDNTITIGDASNAVFLFLQFETAGESGGVGATDQVIQDVVYEPINDMSLIVTSKSADPHYQVVVSLNYLTSTYPNTKLKLGLYYFITEQLPVVTVCGEVLMGEYVMGSENATFESGTFSKTAFLDLSHALGDTVDFFMRAKIESDTTTNDFVYGDVADGLKPKIIQTLSGNLITVAEYNNFT